MKPLCHFVLVMLLIVPGINAFSQQKLSPGGSELPPLTPLEEYLLRNIPVKERPAGYSARDLPAVVDNSSEIFMRPVFNQDGYSCGQAAGIAYNFTYEINRVRNLPADQPQNQYPTHFSWNFMNGGNGWFGVSYLHSFQILKHYGMPNVADYGGTLSTGGPKRWLSGYSEYFNGMHNRISGFSQVFVEDEDDLLTIKGWIHNHLDNSAVGGVASFYANYMSANNVLPPGTPEEGKYVLTYFGGSPNHAMTIVGYNDSIRWDYNQDGQYTNDTDINGDGEVDLKDWEIGGFKMVQSYGGVPNWGDNGYAYMMYKTLADDLGSGGVWNHSVHILDVKPEYDPLLTARVILTHDLRNTVKVITGIANSINATHPEYRLDFPIYDYQGGYNYMQGGTDESDKTIEFGLDLSPLLTHVVTGQPIKFFLEVVEDDPDNSGTGQVDHFSVYDHTGTMVEIISPQSNVPINENDTTRLSLVHTINFDMVTIENEALPAAPQGQPYSCQMIASGGTQPYVWELDKNYEETSSSATFPLITANQLSPNGSSEGFLTQPIDFNFPFFDSSYSSITIHVDGYIMFDEQLYPYPYFNDDKVLFRKTRNISPFMNQYQRISSGSGDGIWYEGNADYAIFRWQTSLEGSSGTGYNYAVKLYPSGNIEFFYGIIDSPGENLWISGISDGDDENMQETWLSNNATVSENLSVQLERYDYPEEFSITPDGLFTGIPQQNYTGVDIGFKVTDNNFIKDHKVLTLAASGVVVNDSVSSGGDQVIEYGETTLVSMVVTNIESDTIYDAEMSVSVDDEYILLVDSTEYLGILPPTEPLRFEDAVTFEVSPDIPDNHLFTLECTITDGDSVWESNLYHTARAPDIYIYEVIVDDENSRLDPGDTAGISITYMNSGGSPAENIFTLLETDDPLTEVIDNFAMIVSLGPNQQETGDYTVYVSDEAQNGHSIDFTTTLNGDLGFSTIDTFNLVVGFQIEDFETGDFTAANWGFAGERPWKIDENAMWEGSYSARSGFITHNQESIMMLDLEVSMAGDISFHKRVFCEDDESSNNNFDFLAFSIDGVEMDRWDGNSEWSKETYPIEPGFHRFEWKYSKDQSVSHGMDGAWIDYIEFPGAQEMAPVITCNPDEIELVMRPDETGYDTLLITNSGPGEQEFTLRISSVVPQKTNSGSRSVLGSYLFCPEEYLRTGEVYTWNFSLYNSSQDSEWIKDLYIDFPPGIELQATTDFTGGSNGDLVFTGELGNGAMANWHGEDASGWGVLRGNETATADITFLTHENLPEGVTLNYEVHGDVYGSEPHIINGVINITNLGGEPSWIGVDTTGGLLSGGSSAQVMITWNTEGMEDGTYECRLLLDDNFSEGMEIPVTLIVDQTLGTDESYTADENMIKVYPNPASDHVYLHFSKAISKVCEILVYSMDGRILGKTRYDNIPAGRLPVKFGAAGSSPQSGIYLLEIKSGDLVVRKKVIVSG